MEASVGDEGPADPAGAGLGPDVEILQVDAVAAGPGGEVEEPDGHADDPPFLLGHVGEHGWGMAEEGDPELLGLDLHRIGRPLVLGQVADQLDQGLHVALDGRPDHQVR